MTCIEPTALDLNGIGARHFDWIERMGWHNRTILESLALIASEVGEAIDECFGDAPTPHFGEELADIVLRTTDTAYESCIDLNAAIAGAVLTWRANSLLGEMAEIQVALANWVNTARAEYLGQEFTRAMGNFIARVVMVAERHGVDLAAEIDRKMAINEQRGTRGRRI